MNKTLKKQTRDQHLKMSTFSLDICQKRGINVTHAHRDNVAEDMIMCKNRVRKRHCLRNFDFTRRTYHGN